jgi:hypothetical protein
MLDVNGVEQPIEAGLRAGEQVVVWVAANQVWTEIRAVVDSTARIPEVDETNNTYVTVVATLTPPPPCTATPDP